MHLFHKLSSYFLTSLSACWVFPCRAKCACNKPKIFQCRKLKLFKKHFGIDMFVDWLPTHFVSARCKLISGKIQVANWTLPGQKVCHTLWKYWYNWFTFNSFLHYRKWEKSLYLKSKLYNSKLVCHSNELWILHCLISNKLYLYFK